MLQLPQAFKRVYFLFCVHFLTTFAFKVAVLSDLHLNPFYDPNIDGKAFCSKQVGKSDPNVPTALLGRIGCDPPKALIETFLQKLNRSMGVDDGSGDSDPVDVLFLPGDFVGHKVSIELNEPDNPVLYQLLKDSHREVMNLINKYLPTAIIVPTLGNNDYKYHY